MVTQVLCEQGRNAGSNDDAVVPSCRAAESGSEAVSTLRHGKEVNNGVEYRGCTSDCWSMRIFDYNLVML